MCIILNSKGEINKALATHAAKFGIELTYDEEDQQVRFWELDNDCEWMFAYNVAPVGLLSWAGNVYLPQMTKEELPAFLDTIKDVKRVCEFVFKDYINKQEAK